MIWGYHYFWKHPCISYWNLGIFQPCRMRCSSNRHTHEADLEWWSLKQVVLSLFFWGGGGGFLHEQTRKEYKRTAPWGHPKFLKIFDIIIFWEGTMYLSSSAFEQDPFLPKPSELNPWTFGLLEGIVVFSRIARIPGFQAFGSKSLNRWENVWEPKCEKTTEEGPGFSRYIYI